MSLLSHDDIRIFIGPQQIDLVRLSGHGKRQVIDARAICLPAAAPGDAPWRSALSALEALLTEFRTCKANAVVVLSNHFVRYALIRHSAEASSAEEERALIHHYFAQIYGNAADPWEFRLSDNGNSDEYRVASAMSPELHESLASLFHQTKLRLHSIQPYLMAAFNLLRRDIGESAWFALVEPGMLCLAQVERGQWRLLRTINNRNDWSNTLAVNLIRARAVSKETATDLAGELPVYVFAPGADIQRAHLEHGWFGVSTNRLHSSFQYLTESDPDVPLFAMALSG